MIDSPGVAIDSAHASLTYGLVASLKPARVLEFGFGAGVSTRAILNALEYNAQEYLYLLVDSFCDWGGIVPISVTSFQSAHPSVNFVKTDEGDFVLGFEGEPYDFIFSDADHTNAGRWFEDVYDRLLAPGGIAVFHDVRAFPSLIGIASACERLNLRHVIFDACSIPGEACQRGLLVVFKSPKESND